MEAFQQRDFKRAKDLLTQAIEGPAREKSFAARTHVRMCEHRLAQGEIRLETPEENYNFAVTMMNRRDFSGALPYFEKALRAQEADHYHYALAICLGHLGNIDQAAEHFRRALELQPRNRALALSDADFSDLARNSQIRELLQR